MWWYVPMIRYMIIIKSLHRLKNRNNHKTQKLTTVNMIWYISFQPFFFIFIYSFMTRQDHILEVVLHPSYFHLLLYRECNSTSLKGHWRIIFDSYIISHQYTIIYWIILLIVKIHSFQFSLLRIIQQTSLKINLSLFL